MNNSKFIAIDLGSNTLRAGYFELINGKICLLKSLEFIVGSARGLKASGRIGDSAINAIKQALNTIAQTFGKEALKDAKAVATQAFRQAGNAKDIFDEIFAMFGLRFYIISANAEAKLSFLGVLEAVKRLNLSTNDLAFVDLGGASIEIGNAHKSKSFANGIITFYESCNSSLEIAKNRVDESTKEVREYLNGLNPSLIALTSGIPTTVAAIRLNQTWQSYDASLVNGYELTLDDFADMAKEMGRMSDNEANERLGDSRKMLVLAGLMLLFAILKQTKARLIVIDDGLREGVAVAYANNTFDKILNL